MAKATVVPAVTETKVVEVEPEKITLELTRAEAEELMSVTGRTRNDTLLSSVFWALNRAGVDSTKLQPVQGEGRLPIHNLRVVKVSDEGIF